MTNSEFKVMPPKTTPVDATMRALFFPIVKPQLLESFKKEWSNWFVLSDEIEEKKCPGKLKQEFLTFNGEMYALAPKTYFSYCPELNSTKDGRKGIPKSYPLTLKDFHATLYDNAKDEPVKINSLRLNNEKRMTRATINRKNLTNIHAKLAVQPDRVTCEPLRIKNKFL